MDTKINFDVIVVGAGIMGSSTAYSLVKDNRKVLLLEKFALPHTRGSSHGASRVTRKSYEQQYYACMMPEAFLKWEELEKESGETVFIKTGILSASTKDSDMRDKIQEALECSQGTYELLDEKGIAEQYPQFNLSDEYHSVFEHDAGILKAHTALSTFQNEFKKHGGILIDEVNVMDIIPGDEVLVNTDKGIFTASRLVITAGPWANQVLEKIGLHLPLNPIRTSPHYWKPNGSLKYDIESFPCFIFPVNGQDVYGLPSYEYGDLVKICLHNGPSIDPDNRDLNTPEWDTEFLKKVIKENFNQLDPNPAIIERCMYTVTPDKDFIIDLHPLWKNIAIGAGFSGTGFKLAPVVGKILNEMVCGKELSYDISNFKMSRFGNQVKSHL